MMKIWYSDIWKIDFTHKDKEIRRLFQSSSERTIKLENRAKAESTIEDQSIAKDDIRRQHKDHNANDSK